MSYPKNHVKPHVVNLFHISLRITIFHCSFTHLGRENILLRSVFLLSSTGMNDDTNSVIKVFRTTPTHKRIDRLQKFGSGMHLSGWPKNIRDQYVSYLCCHKWKIHAVCWLMHPDPRSYVWVFEDVVVWVIPLNNIDDREYLKVLAPWKWCRGQSSFTNGRQYISATRRRVSREQAGMSRRETAVSGWAVRICNS